MPVKFKVQDSDNQQVSITTTNRHQTDNTAITLNNLFTITNFEFDDNVTGTIAVTNGTLSSNSFSGTDVSGITLTPTGLTLAGATSTVTVTVSDGVSGHTNVSATATVINGTPAWATAAGSLGSVVETQSFSATVTVTDTNTNTITHTGGSLPTGITLTDNGNNTATLSGTAPIVTADTTFSFTLTTNDGTISVGRIFTITVTDAVTSWTTPAGTLGTFAELNAVSITVTAANPLLTPAITLQSGTLPSGLSLVDNGNSTATISGTLNTARAADTTTTFTLRATAQTSFVDNVYTITETSIDPVLNNFPLAAIPAGFYATYAISATQSDGTVPAISLKNLTTPSGDIYQIAPGYYTGGPNSLAGSFYGVSPVTQYTENDFTFTDQTNGSANLVIAPKGPILGENYPVTGNDDSTANRFVTTQSGTAIKFTAIATTPQGTTERTYEVPLHPAPTISSGATLISTQHPLQTFNLGSGGSGSEQTFARGVSVSHTLGFEVRNYNTDTVKSGANFSVHDVEFPSTFDSASMTDAGVLTFQVKSSTSAGLAGTITFILRDADTNASRSYDVRIYT